MDNETNFHDYIGKTINENKLIEILGMGRFGVIFKVENPDKQMLENFFVFYILFCDVYFYFQKDLH